LVGLLGSELRPMAVSCKHDTDASPSTKCGAY